MKAILSLQFYNFSRAMLVVSHEESTSLAKLSKSIRQLVGVRNCAVICSHLQEVKVVEDDEDTLTTVKSWIDEERLRLPT